MSPRLLVPLLALGVLVPGSSHAAQTSYPKAKVSFADFKELVGMVEGHRASRLVDLDQFIKMSKEPGVIILDTRSDFRFERVHLQGARHLAFTDFTQANLAKVIPSTETRILIYCNNNFDGNTTDFATKSFVPAASEARQLADQAKPRMMALNVPTYINLYGYGYENVYELDELVNVKDSRVVFEGSIVSDVEFPPRK